jgi:hypothetical protein
MAVTKLTKAVKEDVAKRAAKDLFILPLRKCWETVEVEFSSMVKDIFKDFDWEHVEPYREFIHWHDEIMLSNIPGEWQIHWDDVRKICDLPSIGCIELSFEYPSDELNSEYLDSAYKKRAEDILRPYMVKYFTAKKYCEDIQQILLGINTYKQLEETVPELMKYLPRTTAEAVTALVPIEQINRIRNMLQKEDGVDGKR